MILNSFDNPLIVIIIGKEDCDSCQSAKKYFAKKKIPFVYTDFKNVGVAIKKKIGDLFKEFDTEDEIPYPTVIVIQDEFRYIFFGFHEESYDKMFKIEE